MAGLLGIKDPRQKIGVPPRGVGENLPAPQPMPQGGGLMGGMGSPSQGLFQAYMQQLFNQKYAPPVIPGATPGSTAPGSVQQFNGYRGFGSPLMGALQKPQQYTPPAPNYQNINDPGYVFDWRTYNQP